MQVRDVAFLLAAALLHAGAFVAARGLSPRVAEERSPSMEARNEALTEVDFDVMLDEPKAQEPRRLDPPQAVPRALIGERRLKLAPSSGRSPTQPETEAPPARETTSGSASSEAAPKDTFDALSADPSLPTAPGLGGAPIWAMPGVLPSASTSAESAPLAPVRPNAAASAASAANAANKGGQAPGLTFPTAGMLASAVAEEVRSSTVPAVSEGSFELSVNAKGQLVSVRFLSATAGSGDAWRSVAQAVKRRFAGRALPMTGDFASGSRVAVTVSSRLAVRDGTAHGIPTPQRVSTGGQNIIRQDSRDDRFRAPLRSGSPGEVIASLTFEMDLANIGAKRRRIVSTRVHAVPVELQ